MNSQEHTNIIQEIAQNLSDQSKVTELLTTLSNDYNETLGTIEKLKPLEQDNEALRKANMSLFLQVGSTNEQLGNEIIVPDESESIKEPEYKYEDLFNENGGLK